MTSRTGWWIRVAALALSGAASLFWALVPMFDPPVPFWPLAIPVAIASLPLILGERGALILAAALLTGYAFITGFSIGDLYLPAAVVLWLGVLRSRRRPQPPH